MQSYLLSSCLKEQLIADSKRGSHQCDGLARMMFGISSSFPIVAMQSIATHLHAIAPLSHFEVA